jgi:DNA repair and recombination protein RAD52
MEPFVFTCYINRLDEDVGTGSMDNSKTKSQAYDKAYKTAVTDATKRALKNFGSVLGACLYDKV